MTYLREIGCALCATVGFGIRDGLVVIVVCGVLPS